jgi:hypothetical protein
LNRDAIVLRFTSLLNPNMNRIGAIASAGINSAIQSSFDFSPRSVTVQPQVTGWNARGDNGG